MSDSLINFHRAVSDAEQLLSCYDTLNRSSEEQAPEVLKRATLIMILTAWETYVEDMATELFANQFGALKGSRVGQFLEEQFEQRLKVFNNPDSLKTKRLFVEFFGVDVTESWVWNNYQDTDRARSTLNGWIKRRGEAVHRAQVDAAQPDIVKRDELEKCLRFFSGLAIATDKALESA